MKKLVLLLALAVCGCASNELQFQVGDIVDLKIGKQGQVIKLRLGSRLGIYGTRNQPYLIRIQTDVGIGKVWLDEFELETP